MRDHIARPSNHIITSREPSLLCACLIVKLRLEPDQVLGLQWIEEHGASTFRAAGLEV